VERFGDGRRRNGEGGYWRVLAAGHVSGTIGRTEGVSVDRTTVRATVTADKGDAGIKIQSSKLEVTAYGLKGADAAKFAEIANTAEGRCPVSNAYRGTMQITVETKVL
jgi:organic hydroperoxide reductase OsmC/OhrA